MFWEIGREIDAWTTKKYLNGLWRHGMLELYGVNLLFAMLFLNALNAALVITAVMMLLVAAMLETFFHPKLVGATQN